MTITNSSIIDQLNTKLSGYISTSSQSLCSLTNASDFVKKAATFTVYSLSDLPDAAENIGRLIYIESLDSYRYSNGIEWSKNYDSFPITRNYIWTWGFNGDGQLGNNISIPCVEPTIICGGVENWCQVSAGDSHTAAVRTNGTLWAWGNNVVGQLGDNTVVNKSSPVSIVGGFTDWCQVSAGNLQTAALRTNGTLWAWGLNSSGQLGDNTIIAKSSPVSVVGGFTNWCQVSAGRCHTTAVRTNGTLWAWGYNDRGQLGDNSIVNKSSPVSVVGGFTDWCQVSAGYFHTAAVRTTGSLWAWGSSGNGQLGDGTFVAKSSPVSVVGGFTDWCQVSAGRGRSDHTAAVRTNGTLWTWGYNKSGQLGDNTILLKNSPVSVVGGFTDWCQVSAGGYHTAAVRANGTVWAWGRNSSGQLGDNTNVSRSSPVSVIGGFTNWSRVSAGYCHTAAVRLTELSIFK